MTVTAETGLKKGIKDYLTMRGVLHWYNLQGVGSYKGIPDIFALKHGELYAIEVKTPKGVLSAHQQTFLATVEKAGAHVIVARSIDDVMKFL